VVEQTNAVSQERAAPRVLGRLADLGDDGFARLALVRAQLLMEVLEPLLQRDLGAQSAMPGDVVP